MTREELEKAMGNEPKIQASFEVIGDDVKFIKLIVNGKENIVSVEELITTYTEPCRETDDYENEIEDLQNRLDIAEYDKERLREEVTNLEGKIKALEQEPCDCISRKEVMKALCNNCELCKDGVQTCFSKCEEYHFLVTLPSIQPTTKENLVVGDCISRQAVLDMAEDMTDQFGNKHRVVTEGLISMLPSVTPKPKTDVLDKIKTEIKEELRFWPLTEGLERALEIIDKYKAEGSEK